MTNLTNCAFAKQSKKRNIKRFVLAFANTNLYLTDTTLIAHTMSNTDYTLQHMNGNITVHKNTNRFSLNNIPF